MTSFFPLLTKPCKCGSIESIFKSSFSRSFTMRKTSFFSGSILFLNTFTSAIKDTFIESAKLNGHEIDLADLYKDKFDPIFEGEKANEEIKNYQSRIEKADVIVFIYPIWWFRAPAIVEGFIDRVFIPPWAFQFKKVIGFYGYPIGKLTNKRAIIFNAYGSPRFATVLFFLNLPIRRFKRGFLKICGLNNILLSLIHI